MKPSPCLNPVRVQKADGSFVFVPCGRCDACIAGKGFNRSSRLGDALVGFIDKYFVTLTYSDENLPFADLISDGIGDFNLVHSIDKDYKGVYHQVTGVSFYADDNGVKLLEYCNNRYSGRIPVLCHRHLVNFKKRFRYYFNSYENEYKDEIFIYAVGEYGPTNFRPHYHLIFGFKSHIREDIFKQCIYKAWSRRNKVTSRTLSSCQLGRIDVQRIVGGSCHSYVSQYINCDSVLPCLLSSTVFRQFKTSSNITNIELHRLQDFNLKKFVSNPTATVCYVSPVNSSVVDKPLPDWLENRIFPKFVGYCHVDYWSRVSLYRCYSGFSGIKVGTFVDYFWNKFKLGFDRFPDTFTKTIYLLYYVGATEDSFRHNMTKLWYISKRVYLNCKELGLQLLPYLNQLDIYYKNKELYKLKEFYNLQQSLIDEGASVQSLITLYYDTSDTLSHIAHYHSLFGLDYRPLSINHFRQQRLYSDMMHKIILDTTKTKKRNDYFDSKGLKRRPYLPIFKSKLIKFYQS